jgi:hypothetical protein
MDYKRETAPDFGRFQITTRLIERLISHFSDLRDESPSSVEHSCASVNLNPPLNRFPGRVL